jgi:hypothetical protein
VKHDAPILFASMTELVPSAQLITRAAGALMGDALRRDT